MATKINKGTVFAEATKAFDESMHQLKVELTTTKLRELHELQKFINVNKEVVDLQQKELDDSMKELKTKGVNV